MKEHGSGSEDEYILKLTQLKGVAGGQYGKQEEVWRQGSPLHTSGAPHEKREPAEHEQCHASYREAHLPAGLTDNSTISGIEEDADDAQCEERPPDNPHLVVMGQSGKGKSFVGKVLVTGLLGLGIADVVVLDKDDDYLPLQQFLGGNESQCYDLARGCPLNFFDLPFGPDEVDPNDPIDLLGSFLEQQWLTDLTLLLCSEEERLSKSEEAYLLHVARLTYAACGITSEALRSHPQCLMGPMPTL